MLGRPWTPHEVERLRALYPDHKDAEIADRLGRSKRAVWFKAKGLDLKKSDAYTRQIRAELSTRVKGNATRFAPGQKPWNYGLKGSTVTHHNCKKTQFKKGTLSGVAKARVQPIGAHRISKDGLLQRKIRMDGLFHQRWQSEHSLVWEAHHGAIPKGFKVIFRPGTKTTQAEDIRIENLELVSCAELMQRNTIQRYPVELRALMSLAARLKRKLSQKEAR